MRFCLQCGLKMYNQWQIFKHYRNTKHKVIIKVKQNV